jgi:serine/threonine protein kinase
MTSTQRGKFKLITTRPDYIGPVRATPGFGAREGLVDETGLAKTVNAEKTGEFPKPKMREVRCGATTYVVTKEISEDRVYEVFDAKTGREGILKVIDVEEEHIKGRTRREARILKVLRGQGTARILGEGVLPDCRAFIILEKLDGKTYNEYFNLDQDGKGNNLDFKERMKIGMELAKAIGELHAKGIYHRDLKPENVIVTKEGKVAVIDFGLAKREEDPQLTLIGMTLGTIAYLPPEQLAVRDDYKLHPSADIYAAGVMLFETAFLRRIDFVRGVRNAYQILQAKTRGTIFSDREMDLLDWPEFARGARVNYDSSDYERRISRIEIGGEERLDREMRAKEEQIDKWLQIHPTEDAQTILGKIIYKCTEVEPGRRYQATGALIADLRRIAF